MRFQSIYQPTVVISQEMASGKKNRKRWPSTRSIYIGLVTSIFVCYSDAVCALIRTDCNEIRQANCVAKEHFTVNVGLKHSSTVPI